MPTKDQLDHTIEHKNLALSEVKATDAMQGLFEGYLAVFGNEDDNNDIIEPGAFKKTLIEAHEVKSKNGAPFLYPVLFMHQVDKPCGGFIDMKEDRHGLYVQGKCDLNTELGRMAFSGMQMGYMNQMSIGYDTVKSSRDQHSIRHLLEIRLWEGSIITSGFAANRDAMITQTKSRSLKTKNASGKPSWPLAARDKAWDSGGAHGRLVAWATKDDDSLDAGKMQSVHFWYDESAPDKITSYKLPFCDVSGGDVQAVPKGITAVAGALDGSHGNAPDIGSDASAVKAKVAAYYGRMAKEFDDDTIVAPWAASKMAWKRAVGKKQMGGLQTVTACLSGIQWMYDDIDSCMDMIGDATGLDMDPDEGSDGDGDVGDQMNASMPAPSVHASVQLMVDSLPGFKEAMLDLAAKSQAFDDAIATACGLLGMADSGSSDASYLQAAPILELKVGKQLSAANKDKLSSVSTGLKAHAKTIDGMVGNNGDNNDDEGADSGADSAQRHGEPETKQDNQPESSATTDANGMSKEEPKPGDESTLVEELEALLLEQRVAAMHLSS